MGPAQAEAIRETLGKERLPRLVVLEGAIRSGKTEVAAALAVLKGLDVGGEHIVAGRSMGAVRRNLIPPLRRSASSLGAGFVHHRQEAWVDLGSASMHLFGAVNEKSQDPMQGMTGSGAWLDEVVLMPRSFVEQARARCSVDGSTVLLTCNPGSPSHWVKREIIDRADELEVPVVHFGLDDNPSLSEEVKDDYRRSYTGVFYRRYILGEWAQAEGLIFPSWQTGELPVGEDVEWWCGFDFGAASVTTAVVGARARDGREYVVDEWSYEAGRDGPTQTVGYFAERIVELIQPYGPMVVYGDPSATPLFTELRKMGVRLRKGVNDVETGLATMNAAFSRGELLVSEKCVGLRRDLDGYVWDERAAERGEDAPLKDGNDHRPDALRYAFATRHRSGGVSMRVPKPRGM